MLVQIDCPECKHGAPFRAAKKDLFRTNIVQCPECEATIAMKMIRRKMCEPAFILRVIPGVANE